MIIKQFLSLKFNICCIFLIVIVFSAGCSGGGGGKDPNDVDNDGDGYSENQGDCNDTDKGIHPGATETCGDGIDQDCSGADLSCPGVTGQALLGGPISGASVDLFAGDDLKASIYSTVTSTGSEMSTTGLFSIPTNILRDDTLYLLEISGGKDIDADTNGSIDAYPTDISGTFHAVVTGGQLKDDDFKVNILTDILFQKVSYLLTAKYPEEVIQEELALYSKILLKQDIDGDGDKDIKDILQWTPTEDKDLAYREWSIHGAFITAIYNDTSYSIERLARDFGIVGSVRTSGEALGVAVSGAYAYVANGEDGLKVVDIGNPASPEIVGSVETPGVASNVVLSGTYAYVADGSGGLQVVDIGNPANPEIVGSVDTSGDTLVVAVSGGYAYVAEGKTGLEIVDLSDPTRPVVVGFVEEDAFDVAVSGNFVYVAGHFSGFYVVDVSDPAKPVITIQKYYMDQKAYAVTILGKYAYVPISTKWGGHLWIYDIDDPANPVSVGGIEMEKEPDEIIVPGRYAYIVSGYTLSVIDVDNPKYPVVVNVVDIAATINNMAIVEDFAYLANGDDGLLIVNIGDPANRSANPAVEGDVDLPGDGGGVTVSGDYAYVADLNSGLQIIDINDPKNPAVVQTISLMGADSVTVENGVAYVRNWRPGSVLDWIELIDISNPYAPVTIGLIDTVCNPGEVVAVGGYAYIADGSCGLRIIDLSDPAFPSVVDTFDTPGIATGVAVNDGHVYVADNYSLQVIDIGDPESPFIVGAVDVDGGYHPAPVTIVGNYAYMKGVNRLWIIDIGMPENPAVVGSIGGLSADYGNIAASGHYLYVAGRQYGLQAIDISEPTRPLVVGSLDTPFDSARAFQVAVQNNCVYLTGRTTGLTIYRAIPTD